MLKRVLVLFTLCVVLAAPAAARPTGDLSSPQLGAWDPEGPGTAHAFWQFNADEILSVSPPGSLFGAYTAATTEAVGPGLRQPIGTATVSSIGLEHDPANDWFTSAGNININLKLNNYENPNAYKELWVDIGGQFDAVHPILAAATDGGSIEFSYQWLLESGPSGEAEFGLRIRPNPFYEEVELEITPVAGGVAILDWIHVDTICIPSPGALLLTGLGTVLVGWFRSRKSL